MSTLATLSLADFVSWIGNTGTGLVIVLVAVRWYVMHSVEPRLKSEAEHAGKLGAEKELEAYRGETAKLVETHKADLAAQADAVKARFQKQLTDYAIYVQRRHDAVRQLYTAVVMAKAQAYGIGDLHAEEKDHMRRAVLHARDAVHTLAGAYQMTVLYLPDDVHEQFLSVQEAFVEVLKLREADSLSLEVRPALNVLSFKINVLASVCRAELKSSVD